MVQLPLVPHTLNVTFSPVPMGVLRVPTLSGATRVSARRQGVMVTIADGVAGAPASAPKR
ncbi:unannotated protein [freshwater metagenome]